MCNPVWTAWECISAVYLIQILLIGIGLILGIISLISRDIVSILVDQKPFLKIKEFEFNPQMPRKVRLGLQYTGIGLIAAGLTWIVIAELDSPLIARLNPASPGNSTPGTVTSVSGVSLVSMKYESGGWNPHMVDLRTAASSGIPAGATFPLKFSEITVYAQPELAGYQIWAEFLANGNEKIGETPVTVLQSGLSHLENIRIVEAYSYLDKNTGKYSDDSWDIQKNWNSIEIALKYKGSSGQEGVTIWTIKLNQMGGVAWWNSPPYVNIASIVYSVNDGVQQVLDMRGDPTPVIHAKEGDWITVHAIWYKANSSGNDHNVRIAASINDGQKELEGKESEKVIIQDGIHQFDSFQGMTWVISPDIKWLGLILIRDDETILDSYTIEISDVKFSGLVSTQKSIIWPFGQFEYMDFENNDLNDWKVDQADTIAISTDQSFSGAYSVAVTTKTSESQVYIIREVPFEANLVLGQIFWPQQDGVEVVWAQACVYGTTYCVPISQQSDQWNTFVMDLGHVQDKEGKTLSDFNMSALLVQGRITGTSPDNPYTFYVDGIQIYAVTNP